MTHDIPEVERLTDRIARWIESHDRFDCKSGDTYTAAARAIAEDVVSALAPKPEGETVTDDGVEAAARAMCDRVNGQGDYDENIEQRRSGWMAQAKAGIDAYLAASPKPTTETVTGDGLPLDEMKRTWRTGVETGRLLAKENIIAEARKNLALTQGCLDCNADDERRWADTIRWLEGLA